MINIAGAFTKSHILIPYILQNNLKGKVCVYDGIPNCKWNGGRINSLLRYPSQNSQTSQIYGISLSGSIGKDCEISKIIKAYQKLGIPVFLTFSNFEIDINDPLGRDSLNLLNENDGVILVNENFRNFLRQKYPHLTLIYSITGHPNDYKEFTFKLEDKYDLIVPRFEWIFHPEFCKWANTSKYEIMLNDTCRYGCDKWNTHFQKISEINRNSSLEENMSISELTKIQECWIKGFNPNEDSKHPCMDMKVDAIRLALRLGYKHFKFTGRENEDSDFLYDLNLYIQRLKDSNTL